MIMKKKKFICVKINTTVQYVGYKRLDHYYRFDFNVNY